MEQNEYDEMLRTLVRIAAHQQVINTKQDVLNERLVAAIERLDTTQARIETLLARMIPLQDNGRDA